MNTKEILVSGRVQFVMFRDYAMRTARKLNIAGFVKNIPSGEVYIVAQGEDSRLKEFLDFIKRGSYLSKVENISVKDLEEEMSYANFVIEQ